LGETFFFFLEKEKREKKKKREGEKSLHGSIYPNPAKGDGSSKRSYWLGEKKFWE